MMKVSSHSRPRRHRHSREDTELDSVVIEHFGFQPFTMEPAAILNVTDPVELAAIKTTDPNPTLKAFALAHDGRAKGTVVGIGEVAIRYLKDSVRSLYSALRMKTSLFQHHGPDNSHEGRTVLGHVVGKVLQEVGGTLYDVIIAYIRPEHRQKKLDAASMEAKVQYTRSDGEFVVSEVKEVTGIALADSDVSSPGFPGATLLGAVQAFKQRTGKGDQAMSLTIQEIIDHIIDKGVKPEDIFEDDVLLRSKAVKAHVDDALRNAKGHAKRIEKELGEEREGRSTDAEKSAKTVASLKAETIGLKASPLIAKQLDGMALSAQARAYVETTVENFTTEATDDEGLTKDVKAHIEKGLSGYRAIAKNVFGVEVADEGTKPPDGDKGPGSPPGDEKDRHTADPTDMTIPKNNPQIPQPSVG